MGSLALIPIPLFFEGERPRMVRQTTQGKAAPQNAYYIGFIGLFSFVATILFAMFMVRDIAGANWALWVVFIIMTLVGFVGTVAVGARFDLTPRPLAYSLVYGSLSFAVALLIQIPIIMLLHSSWENNSFKLLAPVSEEYFFRGFIFRIFDLAGSWVAGIIVSAPSFAVFHCFIYNLMNPMILMVLIGAGVVYALFYKFTRLIDVPIIGHWWNNFFAP